MDLFTVLQSKSLPVSCGFAAGVGVLAHVLYFIRGYRVPETVAIIFIHLINGAALFIVSVAGRGLVGGFLFSSAVSVSYFASLFTSIAIYRVFFHPLRHFPGPLSAKISKLANISIAKHLEDHQNDWVNKYGGSIIRIAPNELLLVSIDGQQKVHGYHSKASKHQTFYDFIQYKGAHNLDSITNREEHRWRRQVWDRAFNSRALAQYEAKTQDVCDDWLEKLASLQGTPIDTSLYSMLIAFDNMGKMGYSHDFNTVKAGKEDKMLQLMETTFSAIGQIGQITWPVKLAKDFDLSPEQTEFEELAKLRADEREKLDENYSEDLMKYLLQDLHSDKPKAIFDRNILYSDAQIIMIAGTDTIAAVLSYSLYYLAKDKVLRERLREELAPVFGMTVPSRFAYNDVSDVSLLTAVIHETMRMHNAVGNNGARCTPPEGLTVDGQYIPGNVTVFVGIHAMHRSPKFFEKPDDYIPERWTTRPELIIDKQAFHPFLVGPFNCVGKRIAMTLLRLVLSYTVWHYDFEFAPGEVGTKVFSESCNNLVIKPGPLNCVFTKRE